MLSHGHCCLLLGTDFCNALSLNRQDKLQLLGTSFTHGKASSIPIVFSWGGNISPTGFLPSILLLVVIIVAVVIVAVTVVLVVVVGEGWANEFHQDKASSVRVPVANFSLQSSVQLLRFPGFVVPVANFTLQSSVQLLRENTDSVRSNQRMRPTAPSVPLKLKG
ncbi:hypothetical protein Tco_0849824 [Tanacetum coccineum]